MKQKIITLGHFYTKFNIVDICGFIHQKICSRLKYPCDTDGIVSSIRLFIDSMLDELVDDQYLYLVFDPLEFITNKYTELKQYEV